MGLTKEELQADLEHFISRASDSNRIRVTDLCPLKGGAIQENWLVDAELEGGKAPGRHALVLRASPPRAVRDSHTRAEEFAILKAAWQAGVSVPEPLWLCTDESVIGREFLIMRRVEGVAAGHVLVRDDKYTDVRGLLLERLGEELARIHNIRPPRNELAFLETPKPSPALHALAVYRDYLDGLSTSHPVLELGIRWLGRRAPPPGDLVLCHRDFRTGNYMVDDSGLTGILDWEFASWGDPMEDIGWFCAKCWRFGATGNEAGGIGPRESFYRSYEKASGRRIDPVVILYWEVMANVRWSIIAQQQGGRHLSGEVPSLELALTPRIVPEMELEILNLTRRAEKTNA